MILIIYLFIILTCYYEITSNNKYDIDLNIFARTNGLCAWTYVRRNLLSFVHVRKIVLKAFVEWASRCHQKKISLLLVQYISIYCDGNNYKKETRQAVADYPVIQRQKKISFYILIWNYKKSVDTFEILFECRQRILNF